MANRHQDNGRNGRPPAGVSWGEKTKQCHEQWPNVDDDAKPRNWHKRPTDADQIRRRFGIAPFANTFDYQPYPNCLIHEPSWKDDRETAHVGGTNFLAVGEKGSGKSTWGLYWATRLMEVNDEAVVWRGSSSRSEWLPLKSWTRLFLPANADADPRWKPRDIRVSTDERADLADEVREVVYYEDPIDLNEKLEPGTFNVVYPDPSFAGCQRITEESDLITQPVEWTPKWEAAEPGDATPLIHWWFAWSISKIEHGPYDFVSLIFDEAADFAPDSARADAHETYEKIEALRRVMADSRKFHFSLFFLAHHEQNVHSKIRRTIQWRVDMPDGTANPCQENNDRSPVGFNNVPMNHDLLGNRDVGHLIFWTESNYNPVRWSDIPVFPDDEDRWLKISLSQPNARAGGEVTAQGDGGVADD